MWEDADRSENQPLTASTPETQKGLHPAGCESDTCDTAFECREDRRFYAVVLGSVQGVGYRMFAQREGRRLGLRGYARNLPDGTVEVVAEGSEERLRELLRSLARGPSAAQVEGVRTEWQDPLGEPQGFSIRY